MAGRAEAGFALSGGVTRLVHLHQVSPLRLLFPRVSADEPPTAALVTTCGGLVGGDSLAVDISCAAGASALVMAQAAEKVYRSTGADCRIEVDLKADAGAWLEFLPQETILFDGARLSRRTRVERAAGASVLAGEMLVFGRIARGERMARGLVRDCWEIRSGGTLQWADALHMDGDVAARLDDPAGFAGATAMATLIFLCDDPRPWLSLARAWLAAPSAAECAPQSGMRSGASLVNGVLVARWLGRDALAVRNGFAGLWATLRGEAGGRTRELPRLWHV